MQTKEFLKVLNILKQNIPQDAPSFILKKSFKRTAYTILMATLLSLRTKDENTAKVCKKLFEIVDNPFDMLEIPLSKLEEIVKPTGMYRKKAAILKEVSFVLIDRFDAKVPSSKSELLSIKGIGEKTANIVLNNAFDIPTIAVDTHVHRICNLLGFVETKNEKQTLRALEDRLPKEVWRDLNFTIVSFGQTVCLPKNPKCTECKIRDFCPKVSGV